MSVADLDRLECTESFKARCLDVRDDFGCRTEGGSMRRSRHGLVDDVEVVVVVDAPELATSEVAASGYTADAWFPLRVFLNVSKYDD